MAPKKEKEDKNQLKIDFPEIKNKDEETEKEEKVIISTFPDEKKKNDAGIVICVENGYADEYDNDDENENEEENEQTSL